MFSKRKQLLLIQPALEAPTFRLKRANHLVHNNATTNKNNTDDEESAKPLLLATTIEHHRCYVDEHETLTTTTTATTTQPMGGDLEGAGGERETWWGKCLDCL